MKRVTNVDEVRSAAKRRLPRLVFDFIDGGAEDEVTLRANRGAFSDIAFRTQSIRGVGSPDLGQTLFGQRISFPILIGATGSARLARRQADICAARAAARTGTVLALSMMSSVSLEHVMAAARGPKWFQLYANHDREVMRSLVKRAERAGFTALVCTIDTAVIGRRERDLRNGFAMPFRPRPSTLLDLASHPMWTAGWLTEGGFAVGNFAEPTVARAGRGARAFARAMANPLFSQETLAWVRDLWKGPLLVKGVLTAEEATQALECGADGLIVSNHGGRQLDGVRAAIHALPEVVAAVGGQAEILLDSGVRRGTDVVKALCLGASAVLIGRPWLWGAAVGGEEGIVTVLELFRNEMEVALTLLGRNSVKDLDARCIQPISPGSGRWWELSSNRPSLIDDRL